MRRLIILLGIVFLGTLFISAQNDTLPASLYSKARAINDSIVIRWAPFDYDTWRLGMGNGYRILRENISPGSNSTYSFVSDTIYPKPENTWGSSDPNDIMGLAHALLYNLDQSLYEGAEGAFTIEQDRDNRFGFMLFAADMSLPAAKNMGLSFTDFYIEEGYTYQYQVYIVGTDIQSSYTFVDPANIPPLPQPESLQISFGDEEFHLGWLKNDLDEYYTSYDIEYSTDLGQSFNKMNERPFANLENDQGGLPKEYIFYHDSINNYIEEYQFRVIGHSPFGESGPPSEVVSGKGKPSPLAIFPRITEITGMEDSTFTINWSINNDFIDSIVGLNVIRYENYPGPGEYLNSDMLSVETRTFHDIDPFLSNHYQVEAIDINGYPYISTASLGQVIDSIPPLSPVELIGVVDTILDSVFVIKLQWQPNEEEDLAGYHVFTGNSPNLEFASLTSAGHVQDTFFYDTLPVYTLAENAYYKIKAVDFSGNVSPFSELYTIARPDLIPPVPPNLGRSAAKSANGLSLGWINSPSKDVVGYEVQRKLAYTNNDWNTITTKAKNNAPNDEFLDAEMTSVETEYWYRVIVTDDAGLTAISDTVKIAPAIAKEKYLEEFDYDLGAEINGKEVVLSWDSINNPNIKKVIIYRVTNNGPRISLEHILPSHLGVSEDGRAVFKDPYVQQGNSYLYNIQYRYKNGEHSNISRKASVNFE